MKKALFIILLIPAFAFSQKIETSTLDKDSKKYIIETSTVQLKIDLDDIFGFKIRSVDTTLMLIATGVGETAHNIETGDQLIFFLGRDSAVCTSIRDQGYVKGSFADNYIHYYSITKKELTKLQRLPVESVRMYTTTGFNDIKVKEKRAYMLTELVPVFMQEYNTKTKQLR